MGEGLAFIVPIAAAISAATAVGSSIYQGVSSAQAAGKAEQESNRQRMEQLALLQKQNQSEEIAKATLARDLARQEQLRKAGQAAGRAGTIITGASPVSPTSSQPSYTGSFGGGGKTLLGG